ncbi:MAG: hypothetical protein IKF68_08615 [Erysipelotrichaceae bacterium]|nr:hypothetical protein [Erysipelotrichaceae bacterium]
MKKKGLFISIIIVIALIALTVYNALAINPHDIKVREETLHSSKISEEMDGLLIAYFCDLHYGKNIKEADVDGIVSRINDFDPDIIIFGGDLLSTENSADSGHLREALSSLKGPLGKYAVPGDEDVYNEESLNILRESGFEILSNVNKKIYVNGSFLNIVGVDPKIKGTPDTVSAYEGVNGANYTIVITHCPDLSDQLDSERSDYILSGHSLGGPVYFPLINYFYRPEGADRYYKGKTYVGNARLDISNGVGTINKDIRLFADAEIVLYKLSCD